MSCVTLTVHCASLITPFDGKWRAAAAEVIASLAGLLIDAVGDDPDAIVAGARGAEAFPSE